MEYAIRKNNRFNSIEITFSEKPGETIREALKGLKFRWNGKRGFWYGFTTEEEARAAIDGKPAKAEKKPAAKKAQKINLDGLDKNKKTAYGAEFAAVLRADLKKRGASGFSIRSNRGGYTDSITVTIKMEAEDFRSAEEAAARDGWAQFFNRQELGGGVDVDGVNYSKWNAGREDETHKYIATGNGWKDGETGGNFPVQRRFFMGEIARLCSVNPYHMTADRYPELTAAAFDRVQSILKIVQSYNWDNSDPYTDYFDVGFYLDIDLKKPDGFTPREFMTEAEKAQLVKDQEAEAEAARARVAEYERQRKEAEEAEARRAEQEKKDREEIAAAVTVEDLNDAQSYYIFGLAETIGKECNMKEVKEDARGAEHIAHISRRVTFTDPAALEKFGNMLLHDWEFLRGMGGTGTNDPRVSDANFWKLNSEQRGKVDFYSVKCVAVYLGDVLQFVINPEGYSYARYVYLTTENTREATQEESAEKTRIEEAAEVPPFYFPAPIEEQAEGLTVGEYVTVYQSDDWGGFPIMTAGVIAGKWAGSWAQYKGVYLTIQTRKREKKIFLRDGKDTLIFDDLPIELTDEVKYKRQFSSGAAILREYRDGSEQMREIIKLYASHDRAPIVDTIQR